MTKIQWILSEDKISARGTTPFGNYTIGQINISGTDQNRMRYNIPIHNLGLIDPRGILIGVADNISSHQEYAEKDYQDKLQLALKENSDVENTVTDSQPTEEI